MGRRLFLSLLPSLLAVALVLGLAYYGEYQRQAPGFVVAAAAILAIASVISTWFNTRYLSARISRLAGNLPSRSSGTDSSDTSATDELDRIEQVVDRMDSALAAGAEERARSDARAEARLRDEATMLAAVVRDAIARLDEVRLPIHILLENRFGELNENQEELLASARNATQDMDNALRQLDQIANADRGTLSVHLEMVQLNDVVRAILPLARVSAERRGARLTASLEPGLPRVSSDRTRLAQAITLYATEAANATSADTPLAISTERTRGTVLVTITPTAESVLGDRLIGVLGGIIRRTSDSLSVQLGEEASSS